MKINKINSRLFNFSVYLHADENILQKKTNENDDINMNINNITGIHVAKATENKHLNY